MSETGHYKDVGLDALSSRGLNVAQFVSHSPDGEQRFSRVAGFSPNQRFGTEEEAVAELLIRAGSVNIRSYDPQDSKTKPFPMGITSVDSAVSQARALRGEGLHTIYNENVPLSPGMLSGVALGGVIEVAPNNTPRCVEKPGTVQFTRSIGADIISKVFRGAGLRFDPDPSKRVEFSHYQERRGYGQDHTIFWEIEDVDHPPMTAETIWPNNFSEVLGDKTFGLLVADTAGLRVPQTTVINRHYAPFTFGEPTGSQESWLRTAPNEQTPGLYTTTKGWIDPFELLAKEDPEHDKIASVLCQDGIDAKFSGAAVMGSDGNIIIEGTSGRGDDFMIGEKGTVILPEYVRAVVQETYDHASSQLGPVRFEWVFDGTLVWVVQLHRGISMSAGDTIYPGDDTVAYFDYDTNDGIGGLRELIRDHVPGTGIRLVGDVGITSHFGDLLRKAAIPSILTKRGGE